MRIFHVGATGLVCAALLPASAVHGQAARVGAAPAATAWRPVAAAVLDEVRGGFTAPSGLQLSLGIDRLASVNGTLVAQTSVHIADLRNISPAEAAQAQTALGATLLVQDGQAIQAAGQGLPAGTFIQNTRDGQTITSLTTVNASVNSMSLLKSMNFQDSVRDAGLGALHLR